MKRHSALNSLSREHHYLLILSQVLKQDVPAYTNLPTLPNDQRDYALQKFNKLLRPHMFWEERHLLPLAEHYGDKLVKMAEQIREEHQKLITLFEQMPNLEPAKLSFHLHQTGIALADHVHFEERRFFQKMQELLPEQAWLALESAGQEN